MQKILLLGHNGYLGSYINSLIECDTIENKNTITNGKQYDVVVNCIAKSLVENCDKNPQESYNSNVLLAKKITNFYPNSKIIHFSSYYVYNSSGLCNENSTLENKCVFSKHKIMGEKHILKHKNSVVFRLGKLFGHPDINKQNKLTEHVIKNNTIEVDGVSFNPLSLEQVVRVIKYDLESNKLFGIYNLANNGVITHYEWANLINDFLGTKKHISLVPTLVRSELPNYGKFLMDVSKIKTQIALSGYDQDLKKYIDGLKQRITRTTD